MRDIKFRVWLRWRDTDGEEYGPGMVYFGFKEDKREAGFYFHHDNASMMRESEVMQYTGLKDRHGKEIYEGDLVEYFGKWDKAGNVLEPDFEPHEIVWSMGGFWAVPMSAKMVSSAEGWKGVGHTTCEIIGNTYEDEGTK